MDKIEMETLHPATPGPGEPGFVQRPFPIHIPTGDVTTIHLGPPRPLKDLSAGLLKPLSDAEQKQAIMEAKEDKPKVTEETGLWSGLFGEKEARKNRWHGQKSPVTSSASNGNEPEQKWWEMLTNQEKAARAAARRVPPSLTKLENFELTPITKIIAQSYLDINLLRRFQDRKIAQAGINAYTLQLHDFDKIKANLEKFELHYRRFLNYGSPHGDAQEEAHLVAICCPQSELVKGNMLSDGAPKKVIQRPRDCGI